MADRRVHFVGIGGIGMSGIARLLLQKGIAVSGSDSKESANTLEMRALGATVTIGHTADCVAGASEVVSSTAINPANPELLEAKRLKIPIMHRAQMLARLVNAHRGITIAGTHGKTTTSSMVATLLQRAGIEPSYVVGGIINSFADNARAGAADWFVIEADESDGSLVEFLPEIAVLTNVELDHMDFYRDLAHLNEVFGIYLRHIKKGGVAIWCADDPGARNLIESAAPACDLISYGIEPECGATLTATGITMEGLGCAFTVNHEGKQLGEVRLHVPGRHNVLNALAAAAVGFRLGLSFELVAEGLTAFRGVQRRFQIMGRNAEYIVVDDYAHHPSEIRATLSAARGGSEPGSRIISVFQPHRYSRTASLASEFGAAFSHADEVVVTDIYGAGEDPMPDVSSGLIIDSLRANFHPSVHFAASLHEAEELVASRVRPNDMVITLGAGDIWKVAEGLSKRLIA